LNHPTVECPPDDESQQKCDEAKEYGKIFTGTSLLGVCLPHYSEMPVKSQENWDIIIDGVKKNPLFQ